MNDLPICPPCHGDCNQGRNCNALNPMARLMLEVNRLSIELEKSHNNLLWIKTHAPLTYQAMLNDNNLPK
jgi:hypothetical protein